MSVKFSPVSLKFQVRLICQLEITTGSGSRNVLI